MSIDHDSRARLCKGCGSQLPTRSFKTSRGKKGKTFAHYRCRCGRVQRIVRKRP